VTVEFVQHALAAVGPGAPSNWRLVHVDGEPYVEPGPWAAWVDGLPPVRIKAAVFATEHGVHTDDVEALVRAGALDGSVHKLTGVLVNKYQALVNPTHLVPVEEACASCRDIPVDRVVCTQGGPRVFVLHGVQVGGCSPTIFRVDCSPCPFVASSCCCGSCCPLWLRHPVCSARCFQLLARVSTYTRHVATCT
jgi:hypothetical protein